MTGGQALSAVFVLNQETYGFLDQIPFKTRRLHGELNLEGVISLCGKIIYLL